MTDPLEGSRFKFRFSVWDLILLTSFVAILCALPAGVLVPLVSISLLAVVLLGSCFFEKIFIRGKRLRQAGAMQLMRKAITRGFLYAVFVLVVGALSLLAKGEF